MAALHDETDEKRIAPSLPGLAELVDDGDEGQGREDHQQGRQNLSEVGRPGM